MSRILLLSIALAVPPAVATAQDPTPGSRTIVIEPADAGSLDPALAAVLPGLVAAAVESGGVYQPVVAAAGGGEARGGRVTWSIGLEVSGRGPWQLRARAIRSSGEGKVRKVSSRSPSFSDRATLTPAVDALARDLEAGLRNADPPVDQANGTVPIDRALSGSAEAVDAWVLGLGRIRGGDPESGRESIDQAIDLDPGFTLAAAHKVYTESALDGRLPSAGDGEASDEGASRFDPAVPVTSGVAWGFDRLAAGSPARALQAGEILRRRSGDLIWGRILRGLALADLGRLEESVDDWSAVVASDPDDPRGWVWLGSASMAAGHMNEAAEAFRRARAAWPGLLRAYGLEAEALVRLREMDGARAALEAMRTIMEDRGVAPDADAMNPSLMLGSLTLMEGRYAAARDLLEQTLETMTAAGNGPAALDTLYQTIVELRRDDVITTDPLRRESELEEARGMLDRWYDSLPEDDRVARRSRYLMHGGLLDVKRGDTVAAWKTILRMRDLAGSPGYSVEDEAYLEAATTLREGDVNGCVAAFERIAKTRGDTLDLIDLGQLQLRAGMHDKARPSFEEAESRLNAYSPGEGGHGDLLLTKPRLAAMVPVLHYQRAVLAMQTGRAAEARYYFSRMLKYYRNAEDRVGGMVSEARDRGAQPE